jgi:sodium/bile acid cotransporter 7
MASVLLAGQPLGLIVLPLMIFYQIQVMACAALARHYASAQKKGEIHEPRHTHHQMLR